MLEDKGKFFYMNGSTIAPSLVNLVLMRSGLHWEMHPAQLYALEKVALESSFTVQAEVTEVVDVQNAKELLPQTKLTLSGLPIVMRGDCPMSVVRLMHYSTEITRIEALSIPNEFCDNSMVLDEWKAEALNLRRH